MTDNAPPVREIPSLSTIPASRQDVRDLEVKIDTNFRWTIGMVLIVLPLVLQAIPWVLGR